MTLILPRNNKILQQLLLGHLIFQILQQLLLQRRLLQKVAEITLAIKGTIQAIMKELQLIDHMVTEICMIHTANEVFPGIYTLGDRRKEQTAHKKALLFETTNLLKPLCHCNLRLPKSYSSV